MDTLKPCRPTRFVISAMRAEDRRPRQRQRDDRSIKRKPLDPRPEVIAEALHRAGSVDYEDWWAKVTDSWYCAAAIRLATGNALRPTEVFARCKNTTCTEHHRAGDTIVGDPLCPDCYDYADFGLSGALGVVSNGSSRPARAHWL
ncbi:MAG TPA: hypothetical protein VG795_06550, partial [Acidimicrobiia bacterium]|nr:hypothetical protein [Acidimicrobiia bacterium]